MTNIEMAPALEVMRAAVADAADVPVFAGALGAKDSLALMMAGGTATRDLAGNLYARPIVQVNSKHRDQQDALDQLGAALAALQGLEADATEFQITGAGLKRAPAFAGQDGQGNYIYAAQVEARVFIRNISD